MKRRDGQPELLWKLKPRATDDEWLQGDATESWDFKMILNDNNHYAFVSSLVLIRLSG